ncbi:MAG: Hpt domain-containing protein, partial [Cyanobacteria bacterium J06650_10]
MMIEDEELRSLYQSTCQGRLQVLQTGHLSIANAMTGDDGNQFSNLADIVDLETLRREAHSLKGDSQVMGLEEIADIAQQIEHIIKYWQQAGSTLVTVDERSHFLQPFLAPFETALSAIDQRVNEATAAEANDYSPPSAAEQQLKLQQIIAPLQAALSAAQENAPESTSENAPQSAPQSPEAPAEDVPALGLVSVFITDADLRSLYRTTSTQRLHAITQALNRRVQNAQDNIALDTLRYESQGLKGDSLEAGQGAIAALSDQFAAIANRLPSPHISLTE